MGKAKGSQLSQLKSALSEAGLSRQSQPSHWKRRQRSVAVGHAEHAKKKAAKKLLEIHKRLNPFDVKVTKVKHDVGGRKLKGVTGRPGLSKQAGIEQRKKTLLKELDQRNHAGSILDRRFGENDPTMTPEERMLERFTRERQRASKGVAFNLEDEDELTHYGQSLSAMDDFDGTGLTLDDNEEDDGQIDGETVRRTHFGGFEDEDENNDVPTRKKSKAEVMAEVIAKSKDHKYQRQMEKEEDENARSQVDQDFDSIRGLLFGTGSNTVPLSGARPIPRPETAYEERDDEGYDRFVRELAFEKRAMPKDRTKTEEERALEEKEALERAEKARLQRMMGVDIGSEDEEGGQMRLKRKRNRGGDDLDDDFVNDEVLGGIGTGLGSEQDHQNHEDQQDSGSEEEGISESHSEESQERPDSDRASEPMNRQEAVPDSLPLVASGKEARAGKKSTRGQDLPFIFPCPASHDEFLSIIEGINDADIPTVVQRIRSLYHPSLSEDNPAKLQAFIWVLIDHVLHVVSLPTPQFFLVEALAPHIYALTRTYPVASAQAFVSKLVLMHKNLMRGLSMGATVADSKTWPGLQELAFLRVLGVIWSTSDKNHAVVSSARVLMGAYLGLGRVRSIQDLASGLFLCTMFLQFEDLSKRLIPEAISFLSNAILHLAPHPFEDKESIPGCFPVPDVLNTPTTTMLKIRGKETKGLEISRPNLAALLCDECGSTLHRLNLLATALQLLGKFAESYKSSEGFIELYTPVIEILNSLSLDAFPSSLQRQRLDVQGAMSRLLKFARLSRRPLLLQMHKPIPIASYIPKFSTTSSNFLRAQDPDHERAETAKLRNRVKQERKGAIRELRKDSRFLANVQQRREVHEALAYQDRMKKVLGSIEGERAEQKAMERKKDRDKRKAGRR